MTHTHRLFDETFRLRSQPHHQIQKDFPDGLQLGLNLGQWHESKMTLGSYIDETAEPPVAVSRPHPNFAWGMLANDRLGDCVIAMMLHSIESFHLDAGTRPPSFTDADALLLYSAIAGYDPRDPSTDQGTNEDDAMLAWQQGLPRTSDQARHTIAGTIAVDPANLKECRVAINEFGAVQLGAEMPQSAIGASEWKVVDPNEPIVGGHGIPVREYDSETFAVVTWGTQLLMTVGFHRTYVQEAHVVVTQEMLGNSGTGPSGLHWDDLLSDLKKFHPAR